MSRFAIITAFGRDRPGIVAALAEGLFQLGCNIEDTSSVRLRGEFTMMLLVSLSEDLSAEQLAARLAPYTAPLDLTLLCREVPAEAARRAPAPDTPTYVLSVYGADKPGIVAGVARTVADHQGNITVMNTRVVGAADKPVYVMVLEIKLPDGASPDPLQQALDRLKPSLSVDVTFRQLENVKF
ncbi:MAG: ACT domain-containing protein [Nitrospira sp.]|nr:ACT domain-containing protein [Nitrospira sp.]